MRRGRDGRCERGQGLVEFTLVVPIILLIVMSVAELGLAFGNVNTIGYGSREGARVGSALARGDVSDCTGGDDPSMVDAVLVSAVQRILKSPGSGVDISQVAEIRIFKATPTGGETPGLVNVWRYVGEGNGPEVDPGPGAARIAFAPVGASVWPACSRDNSAATPDSIGVTVRYRYEFNSPLPAVVNAIADGGLGLTLSETTVMSLNPSV
ncbi:MAG: TadE/TadG family type IV pilus assembly protein [Chloroflexota bacterium]|jgi:hypothetical protein